MKATYKLILFVVIAIIVSNCSSTVSLDNRIFKDRNLCKKLTGEVLIYTIFVDDRKKAPWTTEEMNSFKSSVNQAANFILNESSSVGVNLSFNQQYQEKAIVKGLPGKTVAGTREMLGSLSTMEKINKHYDGIAKMCGSLIGQKETVTPFVKRVNNKERLVAKIRNAYQVESVVLIFANKPDYNDSKTKPEDYLTDLNINFQMNLISNDDIEYIVTTKDNPTAIAGDILTLFGASPLVFQENKKNTEEISYVKSNFPKDVMANPLGKIEDLNIGSYTSFLIGWHNNYEETYNIIKNTRVGIYK